MIPLRDVIPSRTAPYTTVTLISLTAVVFVYQIALGPRAQSLCQNFGLVPAHPWWPAAFTSIFLHPGPIHWGGNMLFLWLFGKTVEDRVGHGRFFMFYLLCGVVAGVAHAALNSDSAAPLIGSSGAVAGIMAAHVVLYPQSKIVVLVPLLVAIQIVELPAIYFLGIWFVIQMLSDVGSLAATVGPATGAMAVWVSITGFLVGAASISLFRRPERMRAEWWN